MVNTSKKNQHVLVDLKVHYAKAGNKTSGKVFKLKTIELAPRAGASFAKSLSLADLTTRKHHAGNHKIDAMLNGHAVVLGGFELVKAKTPRRP